ncbi:MAG: hypothetical protein U0289_18150 [Cyclobacteriaceae bacterium]
MDPNLFHLDYERLTEVLITIVILSMIVERALCLLFETKWFIGLSERKQFTAMKEGISFWSALAFAFKCSLMPFLSRWHHLTT